MRFLDDIRICLIFFTRIPVKWVEDLPRARVTRAFQAAPLVAIATGGAGALAYFAGFALTGGSVHIAATLAVAAQLLITGAFHEDGFTDFFDGLGGGSPGQRLSIMRDSRIGTFGACALGLALLLKVFLVAEIADPWQVGWALVAAGAVARAALVLVMAIMPPAADDGASAEAGQPTRFEAGIALAAGGVIALVGSLLSAGLGGLLGLAGLVGGAVAGAAVLGLAARRNLGGQTGDALGATAVAAELGALLGLVALLPPMGL